MGFNSGFKGLKVARCHIVGLCGASLCIGFVWGLVVYWVCVGPRYVLGLCGASLCIGLLK